MGRKRSPPNDDKLFIVSKHADYRFGRAPRQRLLDLAKALQTALDPSPRSRDTGPA